MNIQYQTNAPVTVEEFIAVLTASGLGARRPVADRLCMQGMLDHANLIVTARLDDRLIGIARSVTDFHYACYLSDLAVDQQHQHQGIGKELQRLTQTQLGPHCKLILLAAPDAHAYYAKLGFEAHPRCWVLDRDRCIG